MLLSTGVRLLVVKSLALCLLLSGSRSRSKAHSKKEVYNK